jgi:hypothetical protein
MTWFESVSDLHAQRDVVRRRRYGVILAREGRVISVHFRPWPKLITPPEVILAEKLRSYRRGDFCRFYFNQPLRYPSFLAVTLAVSSRDCRLQTFNAGRLALDTIAEIKGADALLCDAWNLRLSERVLRRWGWEPHCPSRWHRNFIRRFSWSPAASRCDLGAELLAR